MEKLHDEISKLGVNYEDVVKTLHKNVPITDIRERSFAIIVSRLHYILQKYDPLTVRLVDVGAKKGYEQLFGRLFRGREDAQDLAVLETLSFTHEFNGAYVTQAFLELKKPNRIRGTIKRKSNEKISNG